MSPAESGEPGKVAIGRDPFTTGFDGKRREIGVGDQVALRPGAKTQPLEQSPVPRSRIDRDGVRRIAQGRDEQERRRNSARGLEDARVGDDPDEATQDDRSDTERLIGRDRGLQP